MQSPSVYIDHHPEEVELILDTKTMKRKNHINENSQNRVQCLIIQQ